MSRMLSGPAQEKYDAICAGNRTRRLTIKCMRTPLQVFDDVRPRPGLFRSGARETAPAAAIWSSLEFRNGRPACYGGLAEILQCGESLQQPDADTGDGAGQEADAGDYHQDTHG